MGRKRRTIPWIGVRDKVYYVHWFDEQARRTKRLSLGTTDTLEAQNRYAAFLAEGHKIFNPSSSAAGLTVRQALDQYKTEHIDINAVDKVRAESAIRHLRAFFGDRPLHEIDIPASRAYAQARRAGTIGGGKREPNKIGSDSTIRRELVVLKAAARHALRWKRISPSEMPSIELPREVRHSDVPWLTKEEVQRAIHTADVRLKAFIQIAYYTAGRRRSIERLRKSQIDLKLSRINLRAPDETTAQRTSKKRRPVVPLFPEIRPVVERLMNESKSEWLFGEPISMYRRFSNHMKSIGLGEKGNPHILRHSRATHLLLDGVPIYDVARLLGDTITTVDRVYGHHSSEHLAGTIKRLQGG
jgi:integrase